MAAPTDREAIAASLNDPRAFVIVFERHFDAIFRYLLRRVGRARAEELASETFTTAFAVRHRFDASAWGARPWLYGIAVNLLRHHYRSEERELRAYARSAVDPLGFDDSPLEHIEAEATAARVAEALAELTPVEREVLLLYAWADLSYAEIAQAIDVPVGTVRSRLNRARRHVRELLGASGQYVKGTVDG
jgi:RNA polymerase sigma-70 factor (ECF subfamily)